VRGVEATLGSSGCASEAAAEIRAVGDARGASMTENRVSLDRPPRLSRSFVAALAHAGDVPGDQGAGEIGSTVSPLAGRRSEVRRGDTAS
jgi:hypothetical protein